MIILDSLCPSGTRIAYSYGASLEDFLTPQILARRLAEAFASHGEQLYLIGGSVRDEKLGHHDSSDLDFATSARPEKTLTILESLHLSNPFQVGEKFGTIGLRIGDVMVEITTYRSAEMYLEGSRKPVVQFGKTLTQDLERRDFTVNAMARDPLTDEFIDPLNGRMDLESRLIRAVGNPAERFDEDPLRLLRAIRFSATLGFSIESVTWQAIQQCAGEIRRISRERVRDEFSRMLLGVEPSIAMTLLRDSGLLASSIPILTELTLMPDHGPRHPLSLWDHVMRVLDGVPARLEVRWAALLHDIAKPRTRTLDDSGRPRFFHHEEEGARIARSTLSELRYPRALVQSVSLLIDTHMQIHAYSTEWSDGAVRRLTLRLDSLLPDAIALARADGAGHSLTGTAMNSQKLDHLEARIHSLQESGFPRPRSPLSGDDLMKRYARPPGPWIRDIKARLEHEVIEGLLHPDDINRAWEIADGLANGDAMGQSSGRS